MISCKEFRMILMQKIMRYPRNTNYSIRKITEKNNTKSRKKYWKTQESPWRMQPNSNKNRKKKNRDRDYYSRN